MFLFGWKTSIPDYRVKCGDNRYISYCYLLTDDEILNSAKGDLILINISIFLAND